MEGTRHLDLLQKCLYLRADILSHACNLRAEAQKYSINVDGLLFNSIEFVIFLPIVFALYWGMRGGSLKAQNLLLWAAGYVFYGWWDWRFLLLLAASTFIDYFVAQQIDRHEAEGPRKRWLAVSLVAQLGMLGVFKYFNFFIASWVDAWAGVGVTMHLPTLQIVLPVGISFYTFQTMSYVLDVYRGKLAPSRDIISFGAFISFFPQLMAGPIERATVVLPQFERKRTFDYDQAMQGLRLIIWGFFKKVAIGDNCGTYVDAVYDQPGHFSSLTLLLTAFMFALQIYGDFSGYSDIAIGVAKTFGFELMSNFRFPYFSRTVSEFWKRWHISLSTWFQDYLFMPLAIQFRNMRKWGVALAVFLTFLVSGIWHGANWTFVIWGAFHGLLLAGEQGLRALFPGRLPEADVRRTLWQLPLMLGTFLLWSLSLVFFRAKSILEAWSFLGDLAHVGRVGESYFPSTRTLAYVALLLVLDWYYRADERAPLTQKGMPKWMHQVLLIVLTLTVARWLFSHEASFIYFQF
jgi:alginate O-acetyltransferase complex protein AlgI